MVRGWELRLECQALLADYVTILVSREEAHSERIGREPHGCDTSGALNDGGEEALVQHLLPRRPVAWQLALAKLLGRKLVESDEEERREWETRDAWGRCP